MYQANLAKIALGTLLTAGALSLGATTLSAEGTSGKRIAFSNNYAGNTFRQQMVRAFEEVAAQAVKDGVIAEARVFITSENSVTEQSAQVRSLILQGYDAIVITAASGDALNGVVREACDAGIYVVAFDGLVSEECAYKIEVNYHDLGFTQGKYFAERLGKSNLLQIRGIAGIPAEQDISDGHFDGIAGSELEVVGTVYGEWTQTVSQREVASILPTLPEIAGVLTEGGDGFGAAQAFNNAGRPVPLIYLGNRYDELLWWQQQRDANGYETNSAAGNPASSTLAFWVAQQLLAGADVPSKLPDELYVIKPDGLDAALASLQPGEVASHYYTQEEAIALIEANR